MSRSGSTTSRGYGQGYNNQMANQGGQGGQSYGNQYGNQYPNQAYNQGYNQGYYGNQQGYAHQSQVADLRFSCRVDFRGQVTNLDIKRNVAARRGY